MGKKTPRTRLFRWLPGAVFLLTAALVVAAALLPGVGLAQTLYVDNGTTYTLSSGSSITYGDEYVGYSTSGSGTFNQSGGTNTVTAYLLLGYYNSGSYSLSGGTLSAPYEYVGDSGTGTFTQGGGTNTVADDLYLGYGSGSYSLSGGSLSTP